MGRTTGPDDVSSKPNKSNRSHGPRSHQSRTVVISKALSKLLRHQAINEGVPITSDGWVRLDHLLAWRGLSGKNGVSPTPTVEEIWGVVEDNEKKRFAVRWIGKGSAGAKTKEGVVADEEVEGQPTATVNELVQDGQGQDGQRDEVSVVNQGVKKVLPFSTKDAKSVLDHARSLGFQQQKSDPAPDSEDRQIQPTTQSEAQADSETAQAISHYRDAGSQPPPASEFQIRAVQGHSIQTVASDTSLLTPITLDDPSSIPDTCVHGTFYGAWPLILKSGGLKRMGRNHVHFALGPTLAEIGVTDEGAVMQSKGDKVISGMRNDAQLLIYVDLRRCLEDVRELGSEMLWWRSENGVILTEGVVTNDTADQDTPRSEHTAEEVRASDHTNTIEPPTETEPEPDPTGNKDVEPLISTADKTAESQARSKNNLGGRSRTPHGKIAQTNAQSDKLVPMKYWKLVVDVKQGHGVIWKQDGGMVKELPETLTSRGTPKGRGRGGGRGRGRGRE